MPNLLVIDDEPVIQHAVRKAFHPPEYATASAVTAVDGLRQLAADPPDVVILDVHLPDADGLKAFDQVKAVNHRVPIILVTGHGTTELAIEAMKRGAFDYLLKPLRYDQLKEAVDKACASSRLMTVPAVVADAGTVPPQADALVGRSEAMQAVYKAIGRVADTDTTVLILGESGTGKELVARAVYQHSRRSRQPFLAINCGAIPENLIESELFGHEKGAFSGAERKRIGKFEQCRGGTIFLDEVGEMPLLAQVKLLRLLQEQSFERVGGNETVTTDVRVIAATNADLDKHVAAGRFRADLYFRLNVFPINLPPLRDRGADLDLLIDFYVGRYAAEFHRAVAVAPDETRAALRAYRWPGNIRELQSVLKQAILHSGGAILLPGDLSISAGATPLASPTEAGPASADARERVWDQYVATRLDSNSNNVYAECLEHLERELLTRTLQRTGGNQLRAAERLGITRGSLRFKLKSLGITIEKSVWSDDDTTD
ncbi:sigma-54-dependent transcriptional regulator [Limnoglobus roseus]|uniref:DNA-binding transcriptional regulator NtrC n=1 Tax=Limnoglobus roseus TaxID=2598579 RepID=A0A5C1A751_9BACT|nr:sigma-54 dependent transcriptional regulator [Limnoglobus roseus]QEL14093.1 sigma-54-dependent Fis family transcriptional regulator [Limnoglobus roseus]